MGYFVCSLEVQIEIEQKTNRKKKKDIRLLTGATSWQIPNVFESWELKRQKGQCKYHQLEQSGTAYPAGYLSSPACHTSYSAGFSLFQAGCSLLWKFWHLPANMGYLGAAEGVKG